MKNEIQVDNDSSKNALESRLAKLERRGASARWWKLSTLTVVMAVVFIPLAADALGPVPNVFTTGGTISASEMNANFTHIQNGVTANENQVPSGAIIYFNGATCPTGWSEVTAARGRAVVGMPGSAGTLAGTVGTAFTDLEDRTHTHSVDIGAFNSATTGSHTHTTDIGSFTSGSAGSHNHEWLRNVTTTFTSAGAATVNIGPGFPYAGGTAVGALWGIGATDYYTDNEANHTHSVNPPNTTSASSGNHNHSVNPPSTGSTTASTSNVMPYVQYLVCERS